MDEVGGENRGSEFHAASIHPPPLFACSKMPANSLYRRATSATAASLVSLPARQPTTGSQKVVRPTAKPVNPGTDDAISSHLRTFLSSAPRPRRMQLTLFRPTRLAAATIFSQTSRPSSPSTFHRYDSTPASCNCSMASTINFVRSSTSYVFLSPLRPSSCSFSPYPPLTHHPGP